MLWSMLRLSSPPPEPTPALPVLEYGNGGDDLGPVPPPFSLRLTFLILVVPAAVSPVLRFTYDTAPLDVWRRFLDDPGTPDSELLVLATPFFVGLALAAWQL